MGSFELEETAKEILKIANKMRKDGIVDVNEYVKLRESYKNK